MYVFRATKDLPFGRLAEACARECTASGAQLEFVREDCTSKWCVGCGKYNGNLGRRRVFKCGNSNCLLHVPRDSGGALMIFKLWLISQSQRKVRRALSKLTPNTGADSSRTLCGKEVEDNWKNHPSLTLNTFFFITCYCLISVTC